MQNHKSLTRMPSWWWLPGVLLIALDLLCLGASLWLNLSRSVEVFLHAMVLLMSVLMLLNLWHSWLTLQSDQQRLGLGLARLDEAIALFDADDRLILSNPAFARRADGQQAHWPRGTPFETILREQLADLPLRSAEGREDEWLRQRMEQHRNPGEPLVLQLSDGRWVRILERRCQDGSLVYLRSDVSELVKSEQAREQASAAARQAQTLLHEAIEAMPAGFELWDTEDRLLLCNERLRQHYPELAQHLQPGARFRDLVQMSLDAHRIPSAIGNEQQWLEERLQRRGHSDLPELQLYGSRWSHLHERYTPSGYLVGVRLDVTELVTTQQALRSSEAQLQAIISTAGVAIITADGQGQIRSANPAAERLFGRSAAELLSSSLAELVDELERPRLAELLQRLGEAGAALSQSLELCARHSSGQALTLQLNLAKVLGGERPTLVCALGDLTERKRFELDLRHANEQLLRLSTTDALTELANRRLLMQRLDEEWRRAQRSGEPLALLLVDVDHFKLYNDHYGHQAGDACLRRIAEVLKLSANRSTDLVARYGGEEFVLLLANTGSEGAQEVAQRCRSLLEASALEHAISPIAPHVTLSIGLVSGTPQTGMSAQQWLASADLALYQAKAQGRNRAVSLPMH